MQVGAGAAAVIEGHRLGELGAARADGGDEPEHDDEHPATTAHDPLWVVVAALSMRRGSGWIVVGEVREAGVEIGHGGAGGDDGELGGRELGAELGDEVLAGEDIARGGAAGGLEAAALGAAPGPAFLVAAALGGGGDLALAALGLFDAGEAGGLGGAEGLAGGMRGVGVGAGAGVGVGVGRSRGCEREREPHRDRGRARARERPRDRGRDDLDVIVPVSVRVIPTVLVAVLVLGNAPVIVVAMTST
jgi:hypothetical protein